MAIMDPNLDSLLDFENSEVQRYYFAFFFFPCALYESNKLHHQFATRDEIHK